LGIAHTVKTITSSKTLKDEYNIESGDHIVEGAYGNITYGINLLRCTEELGNERMD
jgi:hypothetical protein